MPLPPMEQRPVRRPMGVEAQAGTWVAIHGFLCLALRHPGTTSVPARALVEEFVGRLGGGLVDAGLLTPEQLAEIEDVEIDAQPTCLQCGCTEDAACPGGCHWDAAYAARGVAICSRCAVHVREAEISARLDPQWDARLVAQLGRGE